MKLALAFLLACFLGSAALPLVPGIDLMAMKKQEDERRKKLAKSKIVVTDANVNSISTGGKKYGFVQLGSDQPPSEEKEAAPGAETNKEDNPEKQPEYWKKQQEDLAQRIAGLKAEIESAQLELKRLWSDFYIKSIPAEQQAIRNQIGQLTNEMEQKKVFLMDTEAQLEKLRETARKAGVPPGWLR